MERICMECYSKFKPYRNNHYYCPSCWIVIRYRLRERASKVIMDWVVYNFAPHLNAYLDDDTQRAAEYYRLVDRDG